MADNRRHQFTDEELEAEVAAPSRNVRSPALPKPYGQADFDRLDSQLAAIGANPTSQIRDPRAHELSALLKSYDDAQRARNERVGGAADIAKYLESESLARRYVDAANQVNEGSDRANSLKFRGAAGDLLEDEASRDPQSDYSKSYMDELNRVLGLEGEAAIPRGRLSANQASKVVEIPKFRATQKNKLSEGQAKRESDEKRAAEGNATRENVADKQARAKIEEARIRGRVNLAEQEMKQEQSRALKSTAEARWAAGERRRLVSVDLSPLNYAVADPKIPPSESDARAVSAASEEFNRYEAAVRNVLAKLPSTMDQSIPWSERKELLKTAVSRALQANVKYSDNGVANGADIEHAVNQIGDENQFINLQAGNIAAKLKEALAIIALDRKAVGEAHRYVYGRKGGPNLSAVDGGYGAGYGGPGSSSSGPLAPGGGTYTRQAAESLGMTPAPPQTAPAPSGPPASNSLEERKRRMRERNGF